MPIRLRFSTPATARLLLTLYRRSSRGRVASSLLLKSSLQAASDCTWAQAVTVSLGTSVSLQGGKRFFGELEESRGAQPAMQHSQIFFSAARWGLRGIVGAQGLYGFWLLSVATRVVRREAGVTALTGVCARLPRAKASASATAGTGDGAAAELRFVSCEAFLQRTSRARASGRGPA